jgi:ABC-type branched-subunit amino acid transport system ATPase component
VLPGIQGVVYGVAIIAIILSAPEGVYWRIRDRLVETAVGAARAAGAQRDRPGPPGRSRASSALCSAPTFSSCAMSAFPSAGCGRSMGSISRFPRAGFTASSAPTAPARQPFSTSSMGFSRRQRGAISFAGEPLVGLRPSQVCRRGIGRTFQVVRAFPRMTVLENVIVGAFVGAPDDAAARRLAADALDRVGLSARAACRRRRADDARTAADGAGARTGPAPRLMLLDETLAGLGHDDLDGILEAIRQLRSDGITVLIIEHTMQAMVQLVDHFDVLDHGRLIASGAPETVIRNREVIEAYLGKKWAQQVNEAAK